MVTALFSPDEMMAEYDRQLETSGDPGAFWFFKVAYGLAPKEVAAREAAGEAAG